MIRSNLIGSWSSAGPLFGGDAGGIDHLAPARFVVGEKLRQRGRRHHHRHAAERIARNLAGILSKRLILANAKIDLLSAY